MNMRTTYNMPPAKAVQMVPSAQTARTMVLSMLKYSATPPQMPQMMRSEDFSNLLSIV